MRIEAIIEEDGENLIIPLPQELLDEVGWKVGDELSWMYAKDYESLILILKENKNE